MTALVADAESLLRRIVPDLAGVPVYIIRQSQLPPDRGGNGQSGGWTCPVADVMYRDIIGPRWAGRGVCIIVNDAAIDRCWPPGSGLHRDELLTIIVHEAAHILERPTLLAELNGDPQNASRFIAELDEIDRKYDAEAGYTETTNPRLQAMHSMQFVRLGIHLMNRAARFGERGLCGRRVLAFYCRPRYAGFRAYRAALADELDRLADASFADIKVAPVPPAFQALYEGDCNGVVHAA